MFTWTDRRGQTHRSSLDAVARKLAAESRIERFERLYATTNKPIFAWRAYAIASDLDCPIPDWVLNYFDLSASNLEFLVSSDPVEGEIYPGVARALGFVPGGAEGVLRDNLAGEPAFREATGNFSPVSQESTRDLEIAEEVAIRVRLGEGKTAAVKATAKRLGVSEPTVWRALKSYREPPVQLPD